MLEVPLAQQYQQYQQSRRISLAASIDLQEAPMHGITGNVCNQRSRCSGCEQSPRDAEIRALDFGTMPCSIKFWDFTVMKHATDILRLVAITLS